MSTANNGNCQTRPCTLFRIGIWCDYESPVLPDEGIGVLVYNLIQGLLRLEDPVDVVLLVSPGDQKKVASFTGKHTRLRIVTKLDRMPAWWSGLRGFLKSWVRWSDRIHRRKNTYLERTGRSRERIRHYLVSRLKSWAGWIAPIKILAAVAAMIMFPILSAFLWVAYAIARYGHATIEILTLPIRKLDQGFRRLSQFCSSREPSNLEAADAAGCDAWIVPQVLLNQSLPNPAVVLIHDFASSHFQKQFERWYPGYHERAAKLIPLRAREAAICACMSNFIRDSDLLGVLELPPSKVRVIRSAPPADLPDLDGLSEPLLPQFLKRPFLFFPTAFRPYKNHGGLIEALRILRDRHQEDAWDLVFTGEQPTYLPPQLAKQVQECELQDRVHVLGRVNRKTLAALYHNAFATLVPSFYEQGSFQIYEALQAGCPVACSSIPPFLEQCGPMGYGMLYFDPADPEAIARTILSIRDNREEIRRWQRQASRVLWTRTWDHVAREFLEVCKEVRPLNLRWSA